MHPHLWHVCNNTYLADTLWGLNHIIEGKTLSTFPVTQYSIKYVLDMYVKDYDSSAR